MTKKVLLMLTILGIKNYYSMEEKIQAYHMQEGINLLSIEKKEILNPLQDEEITDVYLEEIKIMNADEVNLLNADEVNLLNADALKSNYKKILNQLKNLIENKTQNPKIIEIIKKNNEQRKYSLENFKNLKVDFKDKFKKVKDYISIAQNFVNYYYETLETYNQINNFFIQTNEMIKEIEDYFAKTNEFHRLNEKIHHLYRQIEEHKNKIKNCEMTIENSISYHLENQVFFIIINCMNMDLHKKHSWVLSLINPIEINEICGNIEDGSNKNIDKQQVKQLYEKIFNDETSYTLRYIEHCSNIFSEFDEYSLNKFIVMIFAFDFSNLLASKITWFKYDIKQIDECIIIQKDELKKLDFLREREGNKYSTQINKINKQSDLLIKEMNEKKKNM